MNSIHIYNQLPLNQTKHQILTYNEYMLLINTYYLLHLLVPLHYNKGTLNKVWPICVTLYIHFKHHVDLIRLWLNKNSFKMIIIYYLLYIHLQ